MQAFCQSCAHFDSHFICVHDLNVMIQGFPTLTQTYKLNISHISQFFSERKNGVEVIRPSNFHIVVYIVT